MAHSIFKTAFAVLVAFEAWTAQGLQRRQSEKSHWVDIWGTMPQLVEPANLPSAPFVSLARPHLKMTCALRSLLDSESD